MKKSFNLGIGLFLAVLIVFSSVTIVYAETIYYYYGYQYTYINNEKLSLYGVDEGMTSVIPPDTINGRYIVDIRNRAFMDNTEITSVDFSQLSRLERIGSFAFSGCTNVTGEISIPANVVVIETAAFQNCSSVESVVYNSTCGYVPNQCFYGCTSLNSVTLNDTVESIGNYAFANCYNLTYMEIPASVTDIADTAFMNDDITLGVYYNSSAHLYALGKGIECVVLDPENIPTEPPTEPTTEPEPEGYLLGDTDDNDDVEVVDATWLQRYIALMNIGVIEDTVMQGDVDADGDPSIVDAAFIMRYCVGIDTPFDIGELVV